MRGTTTLLVVVGAGALGCAAPQPPPTDTMPAARHCELARSRAQAGDCLGAGEHLAFCRGSQAGDTRAAAQRACAAKPACPRAVPPTGTVPAAPTRPTAVPPPTTHPSPPPPPPTASQPPLINPWDQPAPPPTSTQPSSAVPPLHDAQADRACDEAIAAAQRRHCGLAQAHLLQCAGPKQPATQTFVRDQCPLMIQSK